MYTGYNEDSIPFAQETAGYNEESEVQRGEDQQWYLSLLPWDLARHTAIRDCTARPDAKLSQQLHPFIVPVVIYIGRGVWSPAVSSFFYVLLFLLFLSATSMIIS